MTPGAPSLPTRILQLGAFACVLAGVATPLFELDRHTVPKELVLHLSALAAGVVCLAAARRLTVFLVDVLLAGFLALTLLSALFATNGWLAFRAAGVSLAAAALFWTARAVARAGQARPLLTALAAAMVLGAVTALAQAYGLADSSLFNRLRAPGGTFGNRNFMAHLVAIGLPVLFLVTLDARGRLRFTLGTVGVALATAALFLSRSRGGWLGAGLSLAFLAVEGLWLGRLWQDESFRRRSLWMAGAAAAGVMAALLLPNRLAWRSESPYLDSLAGMTNYKDGSGRGRLIQYGNTLAMAAAHPVLGVGPGNWPVHYPQFMSPNDPSWDADDFIPTNPWPSSDWMAMVSERGFPAAVLFALVGASVALGAWARVRGRRTKGVPPDPADLTIVATLIATAVVGAFDAVLLLPAPAYFTWTIVGALASSARPVREIPLLPATRRKLVIAAAVVGGLFVARSTMQLAGMGLYSRGTRSGMEWAARLDPGNYRVRMLLGMAWMAEGRCGRARPHAEASRELFPHHPAPRQLLRACGRR